MEEYLFQICPCTPPKVVLLASLQAICSNRGMVGDGSSRSEDNGGPACSNAHFRNDPSRSDFSRSRDLGHRGDRGTGEVGERRGNALANGVAIGFDFCGQRAVVAALCILGHPQIQHKVFCH